MDVMSGAFLVFAVMLLVSMVAVALAACWWSTHARNQARLEMKRHVQRLEMQ